MQPFGLEPARTDLVILFSDEAKRSIPAALSSGQWVWNPEPSGQQLGKPSASPTWQTGFLPDPDF